MIIYWNPKIPTRKIATQFQYRANQAPEPNCAASRCTSPQWTNQIGLDAVTMGYAINLFPINSRGNHNHHNDNVGIRKFQPGKSQHNFNIARTRPRTKLRCVALHFTSMDQPDRARCGYNGIRNKPFSDQFPGGNHNYHNDHVGIRKFQPGKSQHNFNIARTRPPNQTALRRAALHLNGPTRSGSMRLQWDTQ